MKFDALILILAVSTTCVASFALEAAGVKTSSLLHRTAVPETVLSDSSMPAAGEGSNTDSVKLKPELELEPELETEHEIDIINAGVHLLEDAIAFNASAASELLAEITSRRQQSNDAATEYIKMILSQGPDRKSFPFWTRSKRMARFSRRARMSSLHRTLDRTTPPPSSNGSNSDGPQRRRRALVSLLRSLEGIKEENSKSPHIVILERKANKGGKMSSAEMRARLPEGLETPSYSVVASRGSNLEIRRYEPYAVCAVQMIKQRPENATQTTDAKVQMTEMPGASSFGALAGYLFGKNDQSAAMKMTTPVFTTPSEMEKETTEEVVKVGEDKAVASISNDKQMEFVMPSQFWTEEGLRLAPKPLPGSGVTLQRIEAKVRAVIMFGGYASKSEVAKRKNELSSILSKDQEWKMEGDYFVLAQYNDPFTVPWRRLNEVSVEVIPK